MTADLYAALSEFQAELVTVGKTSSNPFYKSSYAPLDEMMKAAQPVLTRHGLAVVQLPANIDGRPALRTVVMHKSGQSIEATCPLVLSKDDAQAQGSAITYLRRYAYAAALGIVIDEDDDGHRATRPVERSRPSEPADDHWTTGPQDVGTVGTPQRPATSKQISMVRALLSAAGYRDRETQYATLSKICGREVTSSKQLRHADITPIAEQLNIEAAERANA